MISLSSGAADPRSIAFRLRIDDVCSEFETAFGRETSSRIESYVQRSGGEDRPHVLAELIRTERECRQLIGEDPSVSEYLARFPHDATAVRQAFAGAALKPGTRVGKYVVSEKLGAGGMGVVYLAADELVGRRVALKVLSPRLTVSATARERWLAEARSVGRVSHPNVVTLYEAGDDHGACYLVMEHMAGGSAADVLARCGRFEWREATAIIVDVCRGLSAAHAAGLVHLDVKPANILLTARPALGVVAKVSDFGLARGAGEEVAGERIAGTPRYMAPEQMAGTPTDERTDVYGVGATFYALLTGGAPEIAGGRTASDPRDRVSGVPVEVARVVRCALEPVPADRYQSIDELLGALEAARTAPVPRGTSRLRSGVALAALLGCAIVASQLPPSNETLPSMGDISIAPEPEAAEIGPWEPLFDGRSLAGWEARPAPEYGGLESRKLQTPPGVFTVVRVDGGPVVRGQPNGDWRLTTLREFENYQLRLEYRWGRVRPRERGNSGVMYHYRRAPLDESFSKIRFHELDLWPPEVGNLLTLPGVALKRDMDTQPNFERPAPEWNRVDLMCVGDRAYHAINGRLTASYRDARIDLGNENDPPYTSGAVQLQTLTSEVFFRDIKVRRIRTLTSQLYEHE